MKILITGVAGLLAIITVKFLNQNYDVVGIDNINTYYDLKLKNDRLANIKVLAKKG